MWQRGEAIVRRDVWRGLPYAALPVVVVGDEPDLLAVYLPEGAPFGFNDSEWPYGPHPWRRYGAWRGHGVLMLQRPADAYAVWVFWEGEERRFARWYINLQAPFRRTSIGFDSLDHTLDLWSTDGRTWHLKDEEVFEQRVADGYFTAEEGAAIRAEAERFLSDVRTNGPWWDETWADWRPDPLWPVPRLPAGWECLEDANERHAGGDEAHAGQAARRDGVLLEADPAEVVDQE
jgi:Protein of unknown function (DUF402)